jgi:acyl carrier protein
LQTSDPDPKPLTHDSVRIMLRSYVVEELIRDPDYPLEFDEPMITGGLIDSFSLAQIGVFIESIFDLYIPDADLTVEKMDTLNNMAEIVLGNLDS